MKTQCMLLLSALWACLTVQAAGFTTAGNGTTYSFETLSQLAGTGVTKTDFGYLVTQSDTIARGDRFVMDKNATVKFADEAELVLCGEASLALADGELTTLTRYAEATTPGGICIMNTTGAEVRNLFFEFVGLRVFSDGAVNVRECTFTQHNGTQSAAVMFGKAGQPGTIEGCYFEECRKAAIGSAANAPQSLVINRCWLVRNSQANGNVPQINVTVAPRLEIVDCQVLGNPDNDRVGGIGISNFYGYTGSDVLVSGCTVEENRYGLGLTGPARIRIENNTFRNNCHEKDANQGGSGISLYDPYQQTVAVIAGNYIEGSLWGVTVIGCGDVSLGQPDRQDVSSPGGNVFKDNGNGGQLYDLYNNSTLTVYAQNNTWNVAEQTEEAIEGVIFHKNDNPALGQVVFMPAASQDARVGALVSQPAAGAAVYSLHGVRQQGTPRPGVYVVRGRKTILK